MAHASWAYIGTVDVWQSGLLGARGMANLNNFVSSEAVHSCLVPCPNNEGRSRAGPQCKSLVKKTVGMWI